MTASGGGPTSERIIQPVPTPTAALVLHDILDVIDVVIMAVAVTRIIRLHRSAWAHGGWSKLAWVTAAIVIVWSLGPIPVPLGALAALSRTRGRPANSPIPFAEGEPWSPPEH